MKKIPYTTIALSMLIVLITGACAKTTEEESKGPTCLMTGSKVIYEQTPTTGEICGSCTDNCQAKIIIPAAGNYEVSMTPGRFEGKCGNSSIFATMQLRLMGQPTPGSVNDSVSTISGIYEYGIWGTPALATSGVDVNVAKTYTYTAAAAGFILLTPTYVSNGTTCVSSGTSLTASWKDLKTTNFKWAITKK
jgi:hypothetical protein